MIGVPWRRAQIVNWIVDTLPNECQTPNESQVQNSGRASSLLLAIFEYSPGRFSRDSASIFYA